MPSIFVIFLRIVSESVNEVLINQKCAVNCCQADSPLAFHDAIVIFLLWLLEGVNPLLTCFAILFNDNLWVLQHVVIAAVNSVWRTIIISCSFIVVLELQTDHRSSSTISGFFSSLPRNQTNPTLPKSRVSYLKPYAGIKSNYTAFYSGLIMTLIPMTKYSEEGNRKSCALALDVFQDYLVTFCHWISFFTIQARGSFQCNEYNV